MLPRWLLHPELDGNKCKLHDDAYMALLLQRVDMLALRTPQEGFRPPFDIAAFMNRQVSYHLARWVQVKSDSGDIEIAVPLEPIVAQLAAAFMRKGGSIYLGELSAQVLLMMSAGVAPRAPLRPGSERSAVGK